jgi:acetyl-CoA synthetase
MKWGEEFPEGHDLSSLRLLGSVGEPINPEAWMWYHRTIGAEKCPIVDTWWQTETGHIMLTPLPGAVTTKPGSATFPFPGVGADVYDEAGNSVPLGGGGYLVLTRPWPGMLRTIYGDPDRYVDTYWSKYDGIYFAGDGCKRDDEGYYWLLGRVDDVMNVSGHRLSTTEVESALVAHQAVAEAAVVGRKDDLTGEAIAAFVTLRSGIEGNEDLIKELRNFVSEKISPIAPNRRHGAVGHKRGVGVGGFRRLPRSSKARERPRSRRAPLQSACVSSSGPSGPTRPRSASACSSRLRRRCLVPIDSPSRGEWFPLANC